MTKKELSRAVAEAQGLTYKQSDEIVNTVFDLIAGAVAKGEVVRIAKFGVFASVLRKGLIPGKTTTYSTMLPKFKASSVFKSEVNV